MRRLLGILVVSLGVFGAPIGAWAAFPFFADAENTAVLESSSPPGAWTDYVQTTAQQTIQTNPAAAKVGGLGFRLQDLDGTTGAGPFETRLRGQLFGAPVPDVYFRAWLRLVSSNDAGDIDVVWLRNGQGNVNAVNVSVLLVFPGAQLQVGGRDALGGHMAQTSAAFATGTWHLVEVGVEGVSTPTGSRRVWLDGALIHQQTMSWPDTLWRLEDFVIGLPYTTDSSFTGVLDFDNIRVQATPPASRLSIELPESPWLSGSCHEVRLRLRSSASDANLSAPEPFDFALTADGVAAGFFGDPACTMPLASATATFSSGADNAQVWFHVSSPAQTLALRAQTSDLLPAVATASVAPEDDSSPRQFRVTWACSIAGADVAGWMALLVVVALPRRDRRRRGSCS